MGNSHQPMSVHESVTGGGNVLREMGPVCRGPSSSTSADHGGGYGGEGLPACLDAGQGQPGSLPGIHARAKNAAGGRVYAGPPPAGRRILNFMTARKTPGKALVGRIIADMGARGFEPDAKERELLALAEGLADQLDGLHRSVAADGYSTTLETGRIVANPAVALTNTTSLALAKVLAQIQMSDQPPLNLVKQRASKARWRAHNRARAEWDSVGNGAT